MKKPDLETRKSPKVLSEAEQRTEKEISNIKKEMLNKGKGDTKKSLPPPPSKKVKGAFKSGGRVGLRAGSKGCKLATKGKGRAYGKNS